MSTAFQKFCVPRSARASYTCRRSLKTGGRYARCRSHISRPFSCRCKQECIASRALVCPVSRADRYNTLHFASQSRVPKGTPSPFGFPRHFLARARRLRIATDAHGLENANRGGAAYPVRYAAPSPFVSSPFGLFVLLSTIVKWFSLGRASDTSPSTTA